MQNLDFCGCIFKTETIMILHMTRDHNFKMCHMCNNAFNCVEKLKEHFNKDHDKKDLTPEIRITEDRFDQMISEMLEIHGEIGVISHVSKWTKSALMVKISSRKAYRCVGSEPIMHSVIFPSNYTLLRKKEKKKTTTSSR